MGITRNEALDCFQSDDLIGIGMEADAVRRLLHPEGIVSYALDGPVTYTEAATGAGFASLCQSIDDVIARGGTGITLQGEVTPATPIAFFEDLLRTLRQRFPALWLHGLSATEICALSAQSNLTLHDTLARLQDAGLNSIPGNDAGILDDDVQRTSCKTTDWLAVHRTAHHLGLPTTAAMVFGSGETFEHRVHHLEALHQLQQETGGFTAFTPWTFIPATPAAGFEEATAVEYLKTLAISRMVLDNIENIQSNLETQGLKVLQVGLRFGGNDAGSVLPAKHANAATEEQIRQVIRDAGFRPVQRDTPYRTMYLN